MNNTLFIKAGLATVSLLTLITAGSLLYKKDSVSQGDLVIMPRRVMLDTGKRTQELNIANTGVDSAKYLISVIQYKMLANGGFEEIAEPEEGQNFANKNFRFFPRSVTLGPNESQTVKVQVINTGDLKAGEYRSHLYFRAVVKDSAPGEKTEAAPKSVSVKLTPTFGIAIPIIIRNGNTTLNVKLDKPVLSFDDKGIPQLNMTFNRTGNISAYGDVKVDYIAANGKTTQVGIAKGLAVYTPNLARTLLLNLDKNPAVNYHKGKLNVIYSTSADSSESKPVVLATTQIDLY